MIKKFLLIALLLAALFGGCAPRSTTPDAAATQMFDQAMQTAVAALATATPSVTPAPTETPTVTPLPPTPTPDPNRTPPALPGSFQTDLLNPIDLPHTYVAETCEYLRNRWDANNAAPGTVVMPIMFHSITDGEVKQFDQISVEKFSQLMANIQSQGFEAITTDQLVAFLEKNTKIPERSVLLIVDDRKRQEYFDKHFRPYYESNGWKVVNAWISAPDTPDYLWQENQNLTAAGYVDQQAHGVIHNTPMGADSNDEFLRGELFGSIQAIQQHFGKTPVAIIWPGGGFSERPVAVAREAGFRLGFTVNPRGPLMYNWIPLADEKDPGRPSFMPEGQINDPLMVLPRYWDTDASEHLDTVRQIGKAAAARANETRAVELEYYDIVCKPRLGPIPGQP